MAALKQASVHPLLRGLFVVNAGHQPRADRDGEQRPAPALTRLVYCAKGRGWVELQRRLHAFREGDLLVLPAGVPGRYAAQTGRPGALHWVDAEGADWPAFAALLGTTPAQPVARIGADWQYPLLLHTVREAAHPFATRAERVLAAHALGHFLALAACRVRQGGQPDGDRLEQVAQAIVYMSGHLDRRLAIRELAALTGWSPAHFTALFKAHTGCPPHQYLHLLRMHQAARLLRETALSLKEIAARIGYQDPLYFSRHFRAFTGQPPSRYRRQSPAR